MDLRKRTIFFDLGNVLIYFSHEKMCQQVAEYCDLNFELVTKIMNNYGDPYERGHIDNKTLYEEFCQLTKKNLHFETLMHAVGDIFKPNDPVISIALDLKKNGHRL